MREPEHPELADILPAELRDREFSDSDFPAFAKDAMLMAAIAEAIRRLPTSHQLFCADATNLGFIEDETVHLVVTSPPYWTLKEYRDHERQLGHVADYEAFIEELNKVWQHCFRVLVPGGRVVCVVGDVCLSRRKNNGRHTVVPLHASIQESCRLIGFDNLSPIIWHKIANAQYEVDGGGGFLGKPFEPNAIIKNDIEFILMERKPGGYRSPSQNTRAMSLLSRDDYDAWFRQIWHGVTGASTRKHPAPYPAPLAHRLIKMFSFVGDTVLDPFLGSGTTSIAAALCGRNSIGTEIDSGYFSESLRRIERETRSLFGRVEILSYPACVSA